MKTLILGANGMLGSDLVRAFDGDGDVIPATHEDVEIADAAATRAFIEKSGAELVINTAAYHNVPKCEDNPSRAFEVNAVGAGNVAVACEAVAARLVHISTDYVFDGAKKAPYVETDLPGPLNTYAVTKLAGEHFVQAYSTRCFVVRTSGIYGIEVCRAKGANFVQKMLQLAKEKEFLKVVDDEVLTPTYTVDLAEQIRALIRSDHFGLYHITNNGFCSWYEFAKKIFELAGVDVDLRKTTSAEFPSPVQRPLYSVLENKALRALDMDQMRNWDEALGAYIAGLADVQKTIRAL